MISSKTGNFLEINANVSDHEIVNDEQEQAGIDKMGQTSGQHCGICQKVFVEQTDIPALVKPAVIEKTYTGKTIKTVTMSKGKSVGTYSKTVTLSGNYFGKMTNATIKTVKGYGKTSAKKTGLKAKKTYYVQVRIYKTVNGVKYYSPWSKYKKVKTK